MSRPPRSTVATILLLGGVLSVVHYVDNTIRIDRYLGEGLLAERATIVVAWLVFVAFGIAGWILFDRGRNLAAAACIAVYSVSGLIGWLHYTAGPPSAFDLFQNVNIFLDGTAGIALFALAVWIARDGRRTAPALRS